MMDDDDDDDVSKVSFKLLTLAVCGRSCDHIQNILFYSWGFKFR